MLRIFLLAVLLFSLGGCAGLRAPSQNPVFTEIALPEGASGRIPRLSPLSDGLLMSWVEKDKKHARLLFAKFRNGSWSVVSTAAQGERWLVNYADYANVTALDDDHFVASWLVRGAGKKRINYHFLISQTFDGGNSWSKPSTPLPPGQLGEHGFVTLQPVGDDVLVVWVSEDLANTGNYTVRSARLSRDGHWSENQLVDGMTCSCCHPDMTTQNGQILLAYRDRTPQEIRDMALTSYHNGRWTKPSIIHHDGWNIKGCPVQGPAIAASGDAHVTTWFTAAHDSPAVNMAAQLASGNSVFKQLQGKTASGFVDSVALDNQRVAMLWLAQASHQSQNLNVQAIDLKDGRLSQRVIRKMAHRVIGFPSIQSFQHGVYIAYESDNKTIKLLRLNHL
jgi:hypothetical protein